MSIESKYDVLVIGGGPGGIGAAIRAAKQGAKTLIIERYGFLGGMATAGLVNPFMKYRSKSLILTSEVFNEMLERLISVGGISPDGHTFDDELLKYVLDEMIADYNVDVLFHTMFTGVKMGGHQIHSALFNNKSGLLDISAKIFIDSTGDGDVAAAAGAEYEMGRIEDNACQPMTLCFRVGGVTGNPKVKELRDELTDIFIKAKDRGEIDVPREDILLFKTLVPGVFHFNTTRVVGKEATDAVELTEAEIEARRQTRDLLDLFKRESPRFRNAYITKAGTQIGVRETRRIKGEYVLSEEDILAARKFEDGIAKSNYPIDIHNPTGSGTILKYVPSGDYYEVPYRCLLPLGIDNLLVGSRSISCTHEAHSSLRIMPVVASIGEAAGLAASLAIAGSMQPRMIEGKILKQMLFGEKEVQPIVLKISEEDTR